MSLMDLRWLDNDGRESWVLFVWAVAFKTSAPLSNWPQAFCPGEATKRLLSGPNGAPFRTKRVESRRAFYWSL